MQYLLDTHVILWWLSEPEKLSKKAVNIIKDKTNKIFISSASFWEMAIKQSIGRLTLPHHLLETLTSEGFQLLAISAEEALNTADLPLLHNDPFDRLLIMQAKLHDLVLITKDLIIPKYPVVTLKA